MYQILNAYTKKRLILKVDDYLQEGWKLAGGIAIFKDDLSNGPEGHTFCQAVYRAESP